MTLMKILQVGLLFGYLVTFCRGAGRLLDKFLNNSEWAMDGFLIAALSLTLAILHLTDLLSR